MNGLSSDGPNYYLNDNRSTASQYEFAGIAANDSFYGTDFALDLSQQCGGTSTSPPDDLYLYAGIIRKPYYVDNTSNLHGDDDWTSSIPYPQMSVRFDNSSAWVDITGLFEMGSKGSQKDIVGTVTISFAGAIDTLRSDELVVGMGPPKWNATVGFSADSGAGKLQLSISYGYWLGMLLLAACIL